METVDRGKDRNSVPAKKPFLRRGEGIARFGMKSTRLKFKNKPLQQRKPQRSGAGSQGRVVLRSASSPSLHPVVDREHENELDGGGEVRWGCVALLGQCLLSSCVHVRSHS